MNCKIFKGSNMEALVAAINTWRGKQKFLTFNPSDPVFMDGELVIVIWHAVRN